ncbi:MAG: hypothetical protein Q7J98_01605 [Kiritimatiellia bacterium]|nr:hypothetical protein [Kiritimatiellia bacterium]
MTALRWVLFVPAGILAGVLAGTLFRMGSFIFPDIVKFIMCGAGSAAGMVMAGLYVAPKKCPAVKWTMIVLAVILGALSALGSILGAGDKLEAVIGISMVVVALAFSAMPAHEIANAEPVAGPNEKESGQAH